MRAARATGRYLLAAWGASLKAALEYRLVFVLQASFMLLNNLIFLSFWAVFFARFRSVKGWELRDVALLYAISASAFGVAVVLMGGCHRLASRIANGGLDTWLLRSQPLFLQAAADQMIVSGYGDLMSGVLLFLLSARVTPGRALAYAAMTITGAVVLVAFQTICSSLAFFVGNAQDLATQGIYAIVTMSLYPPALFSWRVRVLLYVLIPAGLMAYTPAALVKSWSARDALLLEGGVALLVAAAALVWRAGVRRYESGNLTLAP